VGSKQVGVWVIAVLAQARIAERDLCVCLVDGGRRLLGEGIADRDVVRVDGVSWVVKQAKR